MPVYYLNMVRSSFHFILFRSLLLLLPLLTQYRWSVYSDTTRLDKFSVDLLQAVTAAAEAVETTTSQPTEIILPNIVCIIEKAAHSSMCCVPWICITFRSHFGCSVVDKRTITAAQVKDWNASLIQLSRWLQWWWWRRQRQRHNI